MSESKSALSTIVDRPEYKGRFAEVLGKRAPQFISSMLAISNQAHMRDVDPKTILAAAMTAATLDLPINQNLGFAYIVPYKGNAQFQMGYKGFIQLAMRTGQYRFINACRVFEGELVRYNKLTGELEIDEEAKQSDTVVGYASYFRMLNGFEHALYMTADQVMAHAKRYSQSFSKGYSSVWKDDFDAMALKTVIKLLLSKWGMLSVQMEKALFEDQAMRVDVDAPATYPDGHGVIPQAQIGSGATPPANSPAQTEEPTPRGAKNKKLKVAKGSDKTVPPGGGAESEPPVTTAGPNATEVYRRLQEAGRTVTDLLVVTIANDWVDAPQGYKPGDDPKLLSDVPLASVGEEKLGGFLDSDNWDVIMGEIAKLHPSDS
jgi:recombination protein RecT